MSLFYQQRLHATWPAVQSVRNKVPRTSGDMDGPRNTSLVEAQMSKEAHQKIAARKEKSKCFQKYRANLISNEHDVTVTSDPLSVEEKICLTVYENQTVVPLAVNNSGFQTVHFTCRASNLVENIFTVTDCHGKIIENWKQLHLGSGETYQIRVHFYSEHAGFYEYLLCFHFETCQESLRKFQIMRLLEVRHRTSSSEEPLPTDSLCDDAMLWTRVLRPRKFKLVVPLKSYLMLKSINLRKSNMELEALTPLTWENYRRKFHLLLQLEELQMMIDTEKCNQEWPMFRQKGKRDLFFLQVAGVSTSDMSRKIFLATPSDETADFGGKPYKGWVDLVDGRRVYLGFVDGSPNDFKDGMMFHFQFFFNGMPLRSQHQAVEMVYKNNLREVLFPTATSFPHQPPLHRITEFDNNPEQRKAIEHIVAASAKPSPYLLFGPPGTGKTTTLVEAIKQIVRTQPSSYILACTPSNSATDHLCEKLLEEKIDNCNVYRMYSTSWPEKRIPQNIKLHCNLNHRTKELEMPPKNKMMSYKIILTTLQTAARLGNKGIPSDHYTYIFVDEASQASETECLIPLAALITPQKCQLVLAGDPKQLGPVIMSKLAEKHGMGVSMLERLMNNIDLYKSHEGHGFNKCFVTKLLRNYRSHSAILKIPNELFYNGELQPYADIAICRLYCKWEHLPEKGFPLIFHGVAGTDQHDDNNYSVYNMAEVEVLIEYLKALVDHLHKKGVTIIEPGEIGIIAPYREQVDKIKHALRMDRELKKENLENVLVGTVENFQGQEFNVSLVSTVRSNPKLTAPKQHFTIGFVNSVKRFNVAMTRARSLLIVVGDPRVLKTNPIWNKFIHYCLTNGGYRGISL
ncbi:putative helicase mov-10-B.2 [Pseudoliparis swirei]|uniref:putative helicase mov-10-B.2 n=1 Tax=Pseudoliparis swirei TaxID=2059687 RepID=UPI0024BE7F84|nr:putative helicase mov-10-B.2 [Pseudoliparis swirei]